MIKYIKVSLLFVTLIFITKMAWFKFDNHAPTAEKNNYHALDTSTMADLIIFSYDRPMQLYAYLESLNAYVTNLKDTFVIYRTSDQTFEESYAQVRHDFPRVKFFEQKTAADFKPLMLHVLFNASTCEHYLFGVDDIIMTDFVDISQCISVMDQYNAYGFYLRLGKNITQNYTIKEWRGKECSLPALTEVRPGFFTWQFSGAELPDWRTPHAFDMTILRKKDSGTLFYTMNYSTPNTFENVFFKYADLSKTGACCTRSKMVNIPLNIVQERKKVPNMGYLHPKELLTMFAQGMRIDTKKFFQIAHNAPHMEYIPTFVKKSQ